MCWKDPPTPALVVEGADANESLKNMAALFPRLTIGGFRGLISTILWIQAEDDKNDHKWQDLETKYIIIGNLQPYFVTVYDYHAWNLAYNLSAQWHTEESKYKWVLDGMSYLYKGEKYIPNNSFLMWKEGDLYFQKLGGAFERPFYRAHWRLDQSRMHLLNDLAPGAKGDDSTEGLRHVKAFVTAEPPNTDRAYFHTEALADPSGSTSSTGWGIKITDPNPTEGQITNEGDINERKQRPPNIFKYRADTKKPQDPVEFRYGVSAFYFAYIEFRRSLDYGGPGNLNPAIADAWPAMALRLWCRDDTYYTSQLMGWLFGTRTDSAFLGDPAAVLADPTKLGLRVDEVKDLRRNVEMIAPMSIDQFNTNMGLFKENKTVHTKHVEEVKAIKATELAEGKLFDALVQWHLNGHDMSKIVDNRPLREKFIDASQAYDAAYVQTVKWVDTIYPIIEGQEVNSDRNDFFKYAVAIQARQKGIEQLLRLQPNDKPDMSFLNDDVVEK